MHEPPPDIPERRGQSRELIDRLLSEREELLVLYCRVAGLEPYPKQVAASPLLQRFCQVLVDYTAAVHFEVYGRLAEGQERRRAVLDVAEEHYPFIAETTEQVVRFNDLCTGAEGAEPLPRELSRLGEMLASRFEHEDQVFTALFSRA